MRLETPKAAAAAQFETDTQNRAPASARATDERLQEQVMEALRRLATEGRIYDTGRRNWSERYVWVAVPPKQEQN